MNPVSGKLTVTILSANLTRDVCTFGTMDPKCVLRISSRKIYNSSVKTNEGKHPLWNEIAVFDVESENSLNVQVVHEKDVVLLI